MPLPEDLCIEMMYGSGWMEGEVCLVCLGLTRKANPSSSRELPEGVIYSVISHDGQRYKQLVIVKCEHTNAAY